MTSTLLNLVMAIPSTATATNFYLDSSDQGAQFATSAAQRRDQLTAHLRDVEHGDLVLVGEAAGWRGARQSGVAFTSPTMVGLPGTREASATTVHRALAAHGLDDRALLWNAFPLHPFLPGRHDKNRRPTSVEFAAGDGVLRAAIRGRRVIAVGGNAAASVARVTGKAVPTVQSMSSSDLAVTVRHPSFGGVPEFNAGFDEVVTRWRL
ncbi:uracil-DNA glycosylase [Microbacterium sp. H83]|uniref:uracil-DNA glycosylase n=1 Tax=Microbacterium sp. H83 TaxID=1827324 RepID=UPI0007F3434F|nr:uracil-DNA glycosylase [Microbacterium sp. H83]OAN38846.1 hypothetical protein A4X16_15475 [Microbacterium sp. H83]